MNHQLLPDFTRWSWASVVEREFWNPLFSEAEQAFTELERYAVIDGIRQAAWQFIKADQLAVHAEWAHKHGLVLVPVNNAWLNGNYSSVGSNQTPGAPLFLRCVLTHPRYYQDILPFTGDEKIGTFLGYPKCCQRAFAETWAKGQVDSTWEQLQATHWNSSLQLASTLWRWRGLRLVPHLPCSYSCDESNRFAQQFFDLGRKYGFAEQVMLVREVLNWPVKYSRLFGIAEIESPALKLIVRSDWTPTIQQTSKPGTYNKPNATLWKDNGFQNASGMRMNHTIILRLLVEKLPQGARVLDLGCGNGHLLRRLTIQRPDVKIAGVDFNAEAISRAPLLLGRWWADRIESGVWEDWRADAVLITPGRLLEMETADREATRQRLAKIPLVFVYVYGDWQTKGSLESLSTQAGLTPIQVFHKTPELAVGMVADSK